MISANIYAVFNRIIQRTEMKTVATHLFILAFAVFVTIAYTAQPDIKEIKTLGIDSLLSLAEKENIYAQYELGRRYESGEGVPKNEKQSEYWYDRAAENGNVDAQLLLSMGCNDVCTPIALKWTKREAKKGWPHQQSSLAGLYYEGLHVEKDPYRAFAIYELAAIQGDSIAMLSLGTIYEEGVYTEQNLAIAYAYYKLSESDIESSNSDALLIKMNDAEREEAKKTYDELKKRYKFQKKLFD